jgi:hypothetical protein
VKKFLAYLCLFLIAPVALADKIVLDNKTNYPEKNSQGKIAVQWVASAASTQEANKTIIKGSTLDTGTLMMLSQKGQVQLMLPNHARYFRLVAWSTGKKVPDLLTNWVDIIPDKTYIVNQDQLVPAILMSGGGC